MNKKELVKQHIQQQGEGFKVNAFQITNISLLLEVSPSTVYSGIKSLKSIGAMDDDNIYTGRFVRTVELINAMFSEGFNYCLLTEERCAQLCAQLYTLPGLLYQAIKWSSCYLVASATFYGMSYRRNSAVVA